MSVELHDTYSDVGGRYIVVMQKAIYRPVLLCLVPFHSISICIGVARPDEEFFFEVRHR